MIHWEVETLARNPFLDSSAKGYPSTTAIFILCHTNQTIFFVMTKFGNQLFIDGQWIDPILKQYMPVRNPFTEDIVHHVPLATSADVDLAVTCAQNAFVSEKEINTSVKIDVSIRVGQIADVLENRSPSLEWIYIHARAGVTSLSLIAL